DMVGAGVPCAAQETRAPVLLEKASRGGGSIRLSFTYLSPGTSVTGTPSSVIQDMVGAGVPCAAQETRAPVLLGKANRGGGSIK
ncbi:hypothetical protein ABMA28_006636, partial [Loxostege sticticalis]